jgi:two-component system sensor kinase FixL
MHSRILIAIMLIVVAQPSIWQNPRIYLLVACALVAVQSAIIAVLFVQRRSLSRAEDDRARSERVEAQPEFGRILAELAHADRTSMTGELAAALAHELSQPLAAIAVNAQAALRFLRAPHGDVNEVREILGDIADDCARAGEVIRRVRCLVKTEQACFQTLDVNHLIQEIVGLLPKGTMIHTVPIELRLDPKLPAVSGDRAQLQQVVSNLLLNAFDAIAEGSAEQSPVQIETRRSDSGVEMTVSDHGPGIPKQSLERLFEPFNTSKPQRLGMGLAISRSIVSVHGGRLSGKNNAGGGASFSLILPTQDVAATRMGARHERAVADSLRR